MEQFLVDGKLDIKSLSLEQLTEELKGKGEKAFRAKQCYEWMHKKLVRSVDEMSNLSKDFRQMCGECYEFTSLKPVRVQASFMRSLLFSIQSPF